MDIEQKKVKLKEEIALQPQNVVFARIDISNEIQLADLMKADKIPYFTGVANSSSSNTDTLHQVCINLAKQRALLQGATASDVLSFDISSTTTNYSQGGVLTLPILEDSSYSNKTSFGYLALHDLTEDGGTVDLSSTENANTEIGGVKYFTDFSKYFLTRSRANGELVSIDENTTPYSTPTTAEPFFPANTINGEIYRGTAANPTANTDVRYDFFLVANASGGYAGGGYDIAEDYYTGNTYLTLNVSNVSGTFQATEYLYDTSNNNTIIQSAANTTTVYLELNNSSDQFIAGETLSSGTSNATIGTVTTVSDSEYNVTLTGSTFDTNGNTSIDLGYTVSEKLNLGANTVSRTGNTVTVTANNHGIRAGQRIILKGATNEFAEFNGTFIVTNASQNTLNFTSSNTVSVQPEGDFVLLKNIVYGQTSGATAAVKTRTVNATAQIVVQDGSLSSNLSVGFPIGNTVSGNTSGASGVIEQRTVEGNWHQVRDHEVKTFTSGAWNIDAAANSGDFWLQNFVPVNIDTIVAESGSGSSYRVPKMAIDYTIAQGYDTTITPQLPGLYFAYPLKTWEDQVHDGQTTLEAYNNFASVVIACEGLEINFDWLPLSQDASGNKDGDDIASDGSVSNTAHIPENSTTVNDTDFKSIIGPYGSASPIDDVFKSVNSNYKSSAIKVSSTYPDVDKNPFYPAVGGTHKNYTDTSDGITGTQPGTLTANDIYAGSYTEVQTGAVDPTGDYRYVVQNDLKWVYATDPFAVGSSGAGSDSKTPQSAAFQSVYDGFNSRRGTYITNVSNESTCSSTSSGSTDSEIPASADPPTCGVSSGATTYAYARGTIGSYSDMVVKITQSCVASSGGTYSNDTSIAEFALFYNRLQYYLTSNGGDVWDGSDNITTTNMNSSLKILYDLAIVLKNNATYGHTFEDPNEPTSGTIITDAQFETAVDTFLSTLSALVLKHKAAKTGITANIPPTGGTSAYTVPSYIDSTTLSDTFSDFTTAFTAYANAIKNRITEISNRIGYLNSKDVANGGTGTKSVSGSNQGFQGYAFNGGNGYANTIYSHANFLAGKKINLIGKILTAVSDVEQLYQQITSKRSEFYEYHNN